MENKITISEFEKTLKEIDENVEVVRSGESDYFVKFDEYTTHLCAFVPGTLDNFNIFTTNSYDRGISDKVLYKAIELIPHLVPDDYKEPTKDELFKNFAKKVKDKGFYLTGLTPFFYKLEFLERGQRWFVGEFNKKSLKFEIIQQGNAPRDKYLEGLKLLIDYIEKARSLELVKLYKIPLPGLVTTDGKIQYLTEKNGFYFACRKSGNLKQRWTGEELEEVPNVYREYAVEVEE